ACWPRCATATRPAKASGSTPRSTNRRFGSWSTRPRSTAGSTSSASGELQHAGWPGGAFRTLDEKWIVFTAPAQHLFERLCTMIGQPDLPRDPRFASATERPKHIGVIVDLMRQWFAARPAAKALAELTGHDIPHSPIMSMADIFADPHYRARGTIIDVPAEGMGKIGRASWREGV